MEDEKCIPVEIGNRRWVGVKNGVFLQYKQSDGSWGERTFFTWEQVRAGLAKVEQ